MHLRLLPVGLFILAAQVPLRAQNRSFEWTGRGLC